MSDKKFDFKKLSEQLKKQYNKNRAIISGAAYIILVIVVIYGLTIGVYDGFPIGVPYIIVLLFLFMAFRRLYQWVMKIPLKSDSDKSKKNKK